MSTAAFAAPTVRPLAWSAKADDITCIGESRLTMRTMNVLSAPTEPVRRMAVGPGDGAEVGDWVRRWATGWGLGRMQARRVAGAVRQLGQACLDDGGYDTGVLLLWQDGGVLTCRLTLTRLGCDDRVGPAVLGPVSESRTDSAPGWDGLWGAAVSRVVGCSDLVQVSSGPTGTIVQLSNWL